MREIAHIINPVIVPESSDLFVAQPITFVTMKIAREFARGQVDVTLFSAQYLEDRSLVPEYFRLTPDLERSILEISSFQQKRKLPLLVDILDRLFEASNAEYLIYTNVDIALMPQFYMAVNSIIEAGYDAFTINRRTISDRYKRIDEIPLMYSEMGESHNGHDCFIFRRDVYPKYKVGAACIGINWVGEILIWNIACHAKNVKQFKEEHLTFHIGDDRVWSCGEYYDYVAQNKSEALKVLKELESEYGPFDKSDPIGHYLKGAEVIKMIQELEALVPAYDTFILVDEDHYRCNMGEFVSSRRCLPFLERDGKYWGPPSDDEIAIRELERLRESGANFFVLASPAFWYLDYYNGLHQYLNSNFRCILKNERLVVFDLHL